MRRSILLMVFAATAAFLGACTPASENKPASATPTATASPVKSPSVSPTASPATGDKKDVDKKGEVKPSPTASPAGKATSTPEKK